MAVNKLIWDKTVKPEESAYFWNGEPVVEIRPFPKNNKPKVIELFCGCGGASKGFEIEGRRIII